MYSKKNHKFQNQEIIFGDNRLKLVGTLPEKENIKKFCDGLDIKMAEAGFDDNRSVSDVFSERQVYMSLYGSLFFIGIFIGLLFMAAMVMIIYYKQISEGYDDRERFVIS